MNVEIRNYYVFLIMYLLKKLRMSKNLNKAISFIKYKSFFLLPGCFRATTDKSPFSRNVKLMETETKPRQHWTHWAESKNKDSSFSRESVLTRTNQGYSPGKLSAKPSIYESFKNSPDNPRVYIGVKAQPWLHEAVPDERLPSPVTVSLSVLMFSFLLINLSRNCFCLTKDHS